MPQIKSAYKRLKQNKKKHVANKAKLSELRTYAKKVRACIAESNSDEAEKILRNYESKLSRAVKSNTIKKNNASRRISRLRKQISALGK